MNVKLKALGCGLVAAGLLSACGGQSSFNPSPAVPGSAVQSSEGYTAWVQAVVDTEDDTGEPVNVDVIAMAPTSETESPSPVN